MKKPAMPPRPAFFPRFRPAAWLLSASAALLPCIGSLHAAVLANWRFESGQFLTDSSGNDHTLSAVDGASTPAAFTLGATGNGSSFLDPMPGTLFPNDTAAKFDGGDRLRTADDPSFTDTTLSIEAFVSITSMSAAQMSIAGQWNSTGNQRSYLFAVNGQTGGVLNFLYSTIGSDTAVVASPFTLLANVDYYVAAAIDLTDTSASGITFYLQDLTNGGALQSAGVAHTGTALFNSSTNFTIGSTDQPSSLFNGIIDEVRLSDTKLATSELQIVPEPASTGLLGIGLLSTLARRRRQRGGSTSA